MPISAWDLLSASSGDGAQLKGGLMTQRGPLVPYLHLSWLWNGHSGFLLGLLTFGLGLVLSCHLRSCVQPGAEPLSLPSQPSVSQLTVSTHSLCQSFVLLKDVSPHIAAGIHVHPSRLALAEVQLWPLHRHHGSTLDTELR
jgi:hypothetical protein